MYNANLYWDLLAFGAVLVCALLVAVLLWMLVRRLRKKWMHSFECTPPKLCTPAMSPPPTDGSSLLAIAEPEAQDKTKWPAEADDKHKDRQLTKESRRKKGKSHSADEKSCSSKVKHKSKHRVDSALVEDGERPAGVSGSFTEAASRFAAMVADGGPVSASTTPTGANEPTPVPGSFSETPASLCTPVSPYETPCAPLPAAGKSNLKSPPMQDEENPARRIARPSIVPSSMVSLATQLSGGLLSTGTGAHSDTEPSTMRRRRSTRSKGSKGSGSSRRSDHHREPQAQHSSEQRQLRASTRDLPGKHATADAAENLWPVLDTGPRAVKTEFRADQLSAGALSAFSPPESRRMSRTLPFTILIESAGPNENGGQSVLREVQRHGTNA